MISAGGERAQIDNDGIINLNGYDYAASKEVGYGMSIGDGRANNNNTININRMYGYGMASTEGTLTNNGTINLTNGGYGIMGESGESFNNKDATITITGTPNMQNSYGMSMQDGTAKNFGQIDVTGGSVNSETYGISVNGGNGLNHGLINMHSDNAFGLFDEGDGEITNVAGGTINLYGNNSVGMQTTSGKAENFGTINIGVDNGTGAIVGGSGSTGMIAGDGATAINSGHINMNGNNAVGMTANGGTVINDKSGTITLNGGNGTIFTTTNDGTAINNGDIVINAEDYTLFSTTDSDEGNFQNNGNVTVGAGGSKVIIAGDGNNITNSGKIDLNGKDGFIIYTKGNGSVTNNGTLEIGEDSSNSHGIYMSETATGTVLNDLKGIINVKGTNSSGMTLASDTDTVSIIKEKSMLTEPVPKALPLPRAEPSTTRERLPLPTVRQLLRQPAERSTTKPAPASQPRKTAVPTALTFPATQTAGQRSPMTERLRSTAAAVPLILPFPLLLRPKRQTQ